MNPRAATTRARGLFTASEYEQMRAFFHARPQLTPTPLRQLPALARTLGLGQLMAKDETGRFGLNAFKLLGARFAIESLLADGLLRAGQTVVCASEGNHGRAVARAARDAGCAARVYMAADAAASRVDAITSEGATVIRVDGSYDDAVRMLSADADANGWTIVSDTSWDNYEHVPRLIMLGYTHMMDEVMPPALSEGRHEVSPRVERVDAVFVQGGVGGLLGGIASWCAFHGGDRKPRVVSVEPSSAACLLASARAGKPTAVEGVLNTSMAGLRNREVSPLAFPTVHDTVDAFLAIDDAWANEAMRTLGRPADGDPSISAGASGAAALAGLLAVCTDPSMRAVREQLQLGPDARVLVLISEGVTDPAHWQRVMADA